MCIVLLWLCHHSMWIHVIHLPSSSGHFMGLLPDTCNCVLRMRRECRERFPRQQIQWKPLVSDAGMHHGTCVTHVPWCMSGSLIRGGGENVPGISGACATRNFAYLIRGPLASLGQPYVTCASLIIYVNSTSKRPQNSTKRKPCAYFWNVHQIYSQQTPCRSSIRKRLEEKFGNSK